MKNKSLFACLLIVSSSFIQSCADFYPEGSMDLVKGRYHGPSYDKTHPAPSGEDVGFNIAFTSLIQFGDAITAGDVQSQITPPNSANLLASTREQLSFGSTDAPKPGSFFKSEKFALMTGVEIIRKGNRYKDSFGTDITHLLYLEVPIYAIYRHQLPKNKGQLFGGLGPYFAYGLAGKFKSTYNGQTFDSPAFDTKNGGYNRFDAGVAVTVGYQLPSSLRIRLGYDFGLVNISPSPFGSDGDKTNNVALSLNVGYPLAKIVSKFKKK